MVLDLVICPVPSILFIIFFRFQEMETNSIMMNMQTMEMQNMVININKIIIILVEETTIMLFNNSA